MTEARILIVDDHEVMRTGVRATLESHPGWTVCGEAATGRDAVREAIRLKPDLVVMDITMPELNGLDATRLILESLPGVRVLILSAFESETLVRQMLSSGARGYVLKTDAGDDLVKAANALLSGRLFFTSSVSSRVLTEYREATTVSTGAHVGDLPDRLTVREREIMQLLAEGKTNKEVANRLNLSVKTVETHRSNLMAKLNLHSITDLVRYAIQNEVIRA